MENKPKVNSLAIISFVSGVTVLVSLVLYYALSQTFFRTADIFPFELQNRFLLVVMELSVPVRNLFAPLAVLTGFFGLRQIKKNEVNQKGRPLAWIGLLLGGGWILMGILVSIVFLLAKLII